MKTLRVVLFILSILTMLMRTDTVNAYLVTIEKPCRYETAATRQFYPQHTVDVEYRVDSIHSLNVTEAIVRIFVVQGSSEILLHQDFVQIKQWRTVTVNVSPQPNLKYNQPITIKVVASNPNNPLVTGTGKGYVMIYKEGLNHEIQILRNGTRQITNTGWCNFVNNYNCHALSSGIYYVTQNRMDFTMNGDFSNYILVDVPHLSNGYSGACPNSQSFWSYKYFQSPTQAKFMTFAYTDIYNTAGQWLTDRPCSPEDAVIAFKKVYKIALAPFTQYPNPLTAPGNMVHVYCNLFQGNGALHYDWSDTNRPQGVEFIPDSNKVTIIYPFDGTMNESSPPHKIKVRCHNEFGSTEWKYYQVNRVGNISLCPMINFTFDRERVFENPLLNSSKHGDEDITEHYRINNRELGRSDVINFNIEETGDDHTLIDQIALKRADYNDDEEIAVTSKGQIINFRKGTGFNATVNFTKDITEVLSDNDNKVYEMKAGERIKLTSKAYGTGKGSYYLLLNVRRPALKYDIGGFIHMGKNKTDTFFVKNNENVVCIKIDPEHLNGGMYAIEAAQSFEIDKAELVSNLNTAQITVLQPLTAMHSMHGNMLDRLANKDQSYADLDKDQDIEFSFSKDETPMILSKNSYVVTITGRMVNESYADSTVKEIVTNPFKLNGNYPEPFNPSTTISFEIPTDGNVSLKVFDITGRVISELINEYRTAGFYSLNFDGSSLASGVYFYRLEAPSGYLIRKMTLIK